MRSFSGVTLASIFAAAAAIAALLLHSPLGDPIREASRGAQAVTDAGAAVPRLQAVPPERKTTARQPSAISPPTAPKDVERDVIRYSTDGPAMRRAMAEIIAPAPRATGRELTPGEEDSASRIMYCHLDEGRLSASALLQECLDRAPAFSSVEIPPGRYVFDRQVVIERPVTLRTAGTSGDVSCVTSPGGCATFVASPDFADPFGILLAWNTASVTIETIVIDGNRTARLGSAAARWCQLGRTSAGFNAGALGCTNCTLHDVVSRNALCGTGMVWSGAGAVIRQNEFRDNGDASAPRMWADGLTLLYAPQSDIRQNRFIDNSDIGLIVGHAAQSRIEDNAIVQQRQRAFAGLMLDNFNSNDLSRRGDFRGAQIRGNTIDCGSQLCVFGIQVGPRPWYPTQNIVGGELSANVVTGASVGINVDGAGMRLSPLTLGANQVDSPTAARFADCARVIPTAALNISPTSIVRLAREEVPDSSHLSDPCQFWSALAPSGP